MGFKSSVEISNMKMKKLLSEAKLPRVIGGVKEGYMRKLRADG